MFLVLLLLIGFVSAQFIADRLTPIYTDTLKTGGNLPAGGETFTSCRFLELNDGTLVKIHWSQSDDKVFVAAEIDASKIGDKGWLAIGISDEANAPLFGMLGSNIVIGYIDDDVGFGYLAEATGDPTSRVAPRFTGVTVQDGSIGYQEDGGGRRQLMIMSFSRPASVWSGAKSLLVAYRDDDAGFIGGLPPVGQPLSGGKHDGRWRYAGFDFGESTCLEVPGDGFAAGNPCSQKSTFTGSTSIPIGAEPVNVEWEVDCNAKEIEFTVSGKTGGWLAIGFANEPEKMVGSDTYQVAFENGVARAVNGHAVGKVRPVTGDVALEPVVRDVRGSFDNGELSVSFTRSFDTRTGFDRLLQFGNKYYLNVARHDTSFNFGAKHDGRNWSPEPIEFFNEGVVGPAPVLCNNPSAPSVFTSTLAGEEATLSVRSCDNNQIEFTATGSSNGWLAFGISDSAAMPDTETFQMRLRNGVAEVRHGFAAGRSFPAERGIILGASGERQGNELTVTFVTSLSNVQPGSEHYILWARNENSDEFSAKHDLKTSGGDLEVLIEEEANPECPNDIIGEFSVPLGGSNVDIEYTIDCTAEEIEFTVTGESEGWLAFGFNFGQAMTGTDTYQVRIEGGDAQVRNGKATGRQNPTEDNIIAATGERDGDEITVTFKRKLDTGIAGDFSLLKGERYFVHVAKAPENTWSVRHTERTAGAALRDLFADGEIVENNDDEDDLCGSSGESAGRVVADLDGDEVELSWETDCRKQEMEFTLKGKSDGWLSFGLSRDTKMPVTDTYQVRIEDGDVEVQNGFAPGRVAPTQDEIFSASGSRDDGIMTVTFRRALNTGREIDDFVLEQGTDYYVLFSVHEDSSDFKKVHTARTSTEEPVDFFVSIEDDSASGNACGANVDEIEGKTSVALGDDDVEVEWTIDCEKEEITFSVTGASEGWLAIGFNDEATMPGSDTYQIRFDGDDVEVRNGHADGRDITEDELFDEDDNDLEGEVEDGIMTVEFTRPLISSSDDDISFVPGEEWYMHVASRDTDDDWTKKHDKKASSKDTIDFFELPKPENPCDDADRVRNDVEVVLGDDIVLLSYEIDCEDEEIEFTIKGKSDGWLAFGFQQEKARMDDTDVYQVRIKDGKAEVRNGHTEGQTLKEDNFLDEDRNDVEGSAEDGVIRVSFKRNFDTGDKDDIVFAPGDEWYINVAANDDDDFEAKHARRNWSKDPVLLFSSNESSSAYVSKVLSVTIATIALLLLA